MVYNDVLAVHAAQSVALVLVYMAVTKTEAQEAQDNIVGVNGERIVGNAYSVAGGGLSGNRHVALLQLQRALEEYRTAHVEDYRPHARLVACPSEGAFRAVVVKFRNMVHGSSPSSGSISAEALGTRKGYELV